MALTAVMEKLDVSKYAPAFSPFQNLTIDIQSETIAIQWDEFSRIITLDDLKPRADFRPPTVYCLRAQLLGVQAPLEVDLAAKAAAAVAKAGKAAVTETEAGGKTVLPEDAAKAVAEAAAKLASEMVDSSIGKYMPAELINWLGVTIATKENIQDYSVRSSFWPTLMISVPAIDANFMEMQYRLMYNSLYLQNFSVNIPTVDREFLHVIARGEECIEDGGAANRFDIRLEKLPTLTITGPDTVAPETSTEYILTVNMDGETFDRPIHVDFDTSHGIVSEWRTVVTGTNTFTLNTINVPVGTSVSIKVGFRFWPSLADKKVIVA